MGDTRHRGGVSLFQAFVRNHRNLIDSAKGKRQGQTPKRDSTNISVRGGALRSSVEVSVMEMERRERVIHVVV